LSDLED